MNRSGLVDDSDRLDPSGPVHPHDPPSTVRRTRIALRATALIAGAGGLLFTAYWRLGTSAIIYDEPTYAKAGWAYVHGSFSENREHPPLGKYVFGLGQLLFGRGLVGSRIAAATCGVAIGVVLFFFVKSLVGFWGGAVAAGLWILLPRTVGSGFGTAPEHLDRFAMLDVVMVAFAIAGIYTGWKWLESRAWGYALGTGLLLGLAVASKEPAAALVPVIVAMGIAREKSRRSASQGLALAGTSVLAFVLTYVPFGWHAINTWQYMWNFQSEQYASGHPIYLAHHTYASAPWWAALYYQWVQNGPWVMTILIVACVAALVFVRDWRTSYLLAATIAPMLVVMTSSIVLPHYVFAWLPQLLALAAVGIVTLFRRKGISTAVGAIILIVVAVAAAGWLTRLATLQPKGYARLTQIINASTKDKLVVDGPTYIVGYYLPHAKISEGWPKKNDGAVLALILGHDPRQPEIKEERLTRIARSLGMHDVRLNDIDVWLREPNPTSSG